MKRSRPISALLAAAFGMLPAHAPADALRGTAHVVATTRETTYLDAGRDQGLQEGQRFATTLAGQPVTVVVVASSRATSVVRIEGATVPLAVGAELALPAGRTAPAAPTGPRPPPPETVPWLPSLAADALPGVGFDEGADVVVSASRRRTEVLLHGELSARAASGLFVGQITHNSTDFGLSGNLSIEGGAWTWAHSFDLHYAARPELLSSPFRDGALALDVYLARLGWKSESGSFAANLGRMSAAEGTSVGMIDGGRVSLVAAEHVELGAWAGARPDVFDLSPQLLAPSAGLVARFGARHPSRLAARADVAFAADAWRGELDRAFADVRAGLDLPWRASLDAEAIVDFANDAGDDSAVQLSRGSLTARARLAGDLLDVRIHGGLEDPVFTRSLASQLELGPAVLDAAAACDEAADDCRDLHELFDRRHWYGDASVGVGVTSWLLVDVGARADDGEDGFDSLAVDLGVRVLDVGPLGSEAWLRGQLLTGTLIEGAGGEIGWQAPLISLAHLDLSYALDVWRITPAGDPQAMHRFRLALDRRFGPRFRSTLSVEGGLSGEQTYALVFLLVGVRF